MPVFRPDPLLGQLATVRFDGREYRGAIREVRHEDDALFGSLLTLTLHLTSTIAPSEESTMRPDTPSMFHVHRKPKNDAATRVASYRETEVDFSATQAAEKALRDPSIMFSHGDLLVVTEDGGETVFVFGVNRPEPRLTLVSEDDH